MDASTVGDFFLGKPQPLAQRAEMGTEGDEESIQSNLA